MSKKHNDLRREMLVRALPIETLTEKNGQVVEKMFVEGKAITFNDKTRLFEMDGKEYYETIDTRALEGTDLSDVFLKYNHTDNIMVMARTKNKTLEIVQREDGVYIKAELSNTTAGRDLYELVKRGDIDKMSFAFTEEEEYYDKETRTWTVKKIKKLYDVAAVPVPAYGNTDIYARRKGDLEKRLSELENLELRKKRISVLNRLFENKEEKKNG
jgi:HK97 family phage prohead protease